MKDFPSCFSPSGVQVADSPCYTASTMIVSKTKPSQNSVTCVYQCKLLSKSSLIIINWTKNIMGHCFTLQIKDPSHKHVHIKPSIFSKRKGSKSVHVDFDTFDVNWDLKDAEFGSSPEPIHNFFVGLVFNGEMVLLIGDLRKEKLKDNFLSNSMCLLKREHVFGGKVYGTRVKFKDDGRVHDVEIECDTFGLDDPQLVVRLDGEIVMQVKHLVWKFRGNDRILVDGIHVEVYWDVHNFLFGSIAGSAVFMFRTCLVGGASVDLSPSLGFWLTIYAWNNE